MIYITNIKNIKNGDHSLFTYAIGDMRGDIVKKMIDIDINFADEFNRNTSYKIFGNTKEFYDDIEKYCCDKRAAIRDEIILTMNDKSTANILYQSFHKTYVVELVDMICDFIIL